MLGVSDHARLSRRKRSSMAALAWPALPVREIAGKNAALATPIRAWAAFRLFSAAAKCGRRRSNSLGHNVRAPQQEFARQADRNRRKRAVELGAFVNREGRSRPSEQCRQSVFQ